MFVSEISSIEKPEIDESETKQQQYFGRYCWEKERIFSSEKLRERGEKNEQNENN